MGPGNRDGVPVSGEKSPAGPKGRIGSTDESRRRGAEASRIREVVLLDFPWERELPPAGRWAERNPSLRLPKRERREAAPARSPEARAAGESWMRGAEGAPRGERMP